MLNVLDRVSIQWGIKISGDKTKLLDTEELAGDQPAFTLNGYALKEVDFCLGGEVEQTNRIERDVGIRLEKAAIYCLSNVVSEL